MMSFAELKSITLLDWIETKILFIHEITTNTNTLGYQGREICMNHQDI